MPAALMRGRSRADMAGRGTEARAARAIVVRHLAAARARGNCGP